MGNKIPNAKYLNHRFTFRDQLLKKVGDPKFQNVEECKIHRPGYPMYMKRQKVVFTLNGQELVGIIDIVDAYGVVGKSDQPYYGILVCDHGTFVLYKEIPESKINIF